MIAQGADGTEAMTTIVAPSDPEAFKELWHFRTREGHDEVGLTDAGAIVTEKLATKLGLSVGDAIAFAEQDDLGNATATTYSVPVTGIIENYIGDYAFMTPETYARTFGEEPGQPHGVRPGHHRRGGAFCALRGPCALRGRWTPWPSTTRSSTLTSRCCAR